MGEPAAVVTGNGAEHAAETLTVGSTQLLKALLYGLRAPAWNLNAMAEDSFWPTTVSISQWPNSSRLFTATGRSSILIPYSRL